MDTVRLREAIDTLRVEKNWSMGEVITYLDYSPSFIYYLLAGARQPDLLTAHDLAEKLGYSIDDLMPEVGVTAKGA